MKIMSGRSGIQDRPIFVILCYFSFCSLGSSVVSDNFIVIGFIVCTVGSSCRGGVQA